MVKALFNPWVLLILLGTNVASAGLAWWKTSSYEQDMCLARVRLANQTVQAAQDRLRNRISSEQFVRAAQRSHAARIRDAAYGDILVITGEAAVAGCNMPKPWWQKLHEIK